MVRVFYKGHKRLVHVGKKGGKYVIVEGNKIYLKPKTKAKPVKRKRNKTKQAKKKVVKRKSEKKKPGKQKIMKGGLYVDPLNNKNFSNSNLRNFISEISEKTPDPTKSPWFRYPPGNDDNPIEWMRIHRNAAVNALSNDPQNLIKLKTKKSRVPAGFTGQKYNKNELDEVVEKMKFEFEKMTKEELFAFYFIKNKTQIIEYIEKNHLGFREFYGFMGDEVYKILKNFYQI